MSTFSPVSPLPRQLTLYVNYACNLRCRQCYLYGVADVHRPYMKPAKADAMSWDVFQRSVDPLIEMQTPLTVFLMGGEPCLHPKLPDMIAHIKRGTHTYVDMNTNGMFLRRCADLLLDAGIDALYISLDGSTAAINDSIRGRGCFDSAIDGISLLKQRIAQRGLGTKVAINHTITNRNFSDLVSMARLAETLGVDELFFNLPSFVTPEAGVKAQAILQKEMGIDFQSWRGFDIGSEIEGIPPEALADAMRELMSKRSWPFSLFLQPVRHSIDELSGYFDQRWERIARRRSCEVLSFRTTVLPNGDVTPCTIFPDVVVGNVVDRDLASVWRGEKYDKFRALIGRSLLPTCTRCCDLFDETQGDPDAFLSGSRTSLSLTEAANGGASA